MTDLPASLIDHLEQRDASRADAVTAKLSSLTDWERALIKDAAVMGYVQGMRHPQGEPYPGDVNVVPIVIDACISPAFADLYPAINAETKPTEEEQRNLAFERNQYAAAIRQLIVRIKQTAYVWSQTLPDMIPTAEVVKALGLLAPMPLPEDLRDDLWQRIVGAYYLRFENDGHPEDAQAAADEAMAIVQPELDRLRAELEQARNEAAPTAPTKKPQPAAAYGDGRGYLRIYCLACPRPVDVGLPLTVEDIDPGEACTRCGRLVVDVAREIADKEA